MDGGLLGGGVVGGGEDDGHGYEMVLSMMLSLGGVLIRYKVQPASQTMKRPSQGIHPLTCLFPSLALTKVRMCDKVGTKEHLSFDGDFFGMYFFPLILIFGTLTSGAKLVCLGEGSAAPLGVLYMNFSRMSFTRPRTAQTLPSMTAQSADDFTQSNLIHDPPSVTYNLLSQTRQSGLGQGGQSLFKSAKAFGYVTVEFARELAKLTVQ